MPTDWIDLAGVVNMRDLGGLPTTDGHRIRSRRLIRSDNLQDLTAADVRRLVDELGVTDVVDLRSDTEVHSEGPGPLVRERSLTHHQHSLFRDRPADDTASDVLVPGRGSDADRADPAYWAGHYLGYLRERSESVSAALHVVADSRGATVVHCAAGKDRTGTIVGLALDVAGVPHDVIVEDYVRTGERLEAIFGRLADRPAYREHLLGRSATEETPLPEAMGAILRYAAEEFGGSAGWLLAHGWSHPQVTRLRDSLREPVSSAG